MKLSCRTKGQDKHYTIKQYNKPRKSYTLWPRLYKTIPSPFRLPQRSLSSQSLGKYEQLNQNNQKKKLVPWGTDGRLPLTLTLVPAIRHTVVHHSSTSTYVPNFIEIGRKIFSKVTTEVLVKFRVT